MSHSALREKLLELLSPELTGIQVEVRHSDRWDRTCLTFRWEGFTDTLPEERFRHLLLHIPPDFREEHLQGAVWLELAPAETVETYLALPRSEDVADRQQTIARRLIRSGFFEALEERLGPLPVELCMANFAVTRELLREQGYSKQQCDEACLLFILHRAYSDCDVLVEAKRSILALEKPS
ncbi:MAG: hypothetical protein JSV19_12935 [Phycisphaerales bacterium]|nr:MAG: hypothetical protein JSV19_12935 [Phycisphaerales bacterium]